MRRSLLAVGALALFAGAGCAQWNGQVAARVGDTEIRVDELERDMTVVAPDAPKLDGRIDTASIGKALSVRIQGALFDRELAQRDLAVTPQEIESARGLLAQQSQSVAPTEDLIRFVAAQRKLQAAVARDPGGPPSSAEALLEEDPQSFAPVCVELASAADAAVAEQLLAAIGSGTALGEAAAGLGSEVQSDCLAPATLEAQGFVMLAAALRRAKADDVIGPLEETSQGLLLVGVVTSISEPDLGAATKVWDDATGAALRTVLLEGAKDDVDLRRSSIRRVGPLDAVATAPRQRGRDTLMRRLVGAALLAAALGAGCSSSQPDAQASSAPSTVGSVVVNYEFSGSAANVEGTDIPAARLGSRVNEVQVSPEVAQVVLGTAGNLTQPGTSQPNPAVVTAILDEEISFILIDAEVAKRAIAVTDRHRELARIQFNAKYGGYGDKLPQAFVDRYLDQYAKSIALDIALKPLIADAELRAAYDKEPAKYERACVRHILLTSEADAAKAVADIKAGADFATVAKERSQDGGSAPAGGELGCVARGTFVDSFEKATWEAPVNTVLGPVASEFGLHVIQVTRREVFSFDEAKEDVRAELSPPVFQELGSWLQVRRAAAKVAVDERYGTWDDLLGQLIPLGGAASGLTLTPADGQTTPTTG